MCREERRFFRGAHERGGQGGDHVGVCGGASQFFYERGPILDAFADCLAGDERIGRASDATYAREALDRHTRGIWADAARWIADGDREHLERILEWPLADLLHAYRLKLKKASSEHYTDELTVWALLAPHAKKAPNPPDVPAILKD